MALPYFPLFVDFLDPALTGLYPTFSSQVKTTSIATVRNKILPLAIVAMQANSAGTTPWTASDISLATISVSIDNPDLFPTQGEFYLNDGSGPTPPLISNIGNQNLQNALNALANTTAVGGVSVEIIGTDFVVTWNENGAQSLLTASPGSLYPASTIVVTQLQEGTSNQPEIQSIQIAQLPATSQTSFTLISGSPATMNGILSLDTPGMLARFDALAPGTISFDAILQVDVQFSGEGPQTILQMPVTVHRDVIRNGISSLPVFSTPLTTQNGIESLFGIVTALSSGAGTLSGLPTVNGQRQTPGGVLFSLASNGITNGWFLTTYIGQSGTGFQEPDDFNASTNPVIWQQFL